MNKDFDYKEVPSTYLHCLQEQCPRSAECLRFQVTLHIDPDIPHFLVINPGYIAGKEEKCLYFRPDCKICFAVGITHIFDNIPHTKAVRLKNILYSHFGRSMYYRIRNKERFMKPDEQVFIRETFKKEGIQEEPVFDKYIYQYNW